jgi:hypothetical protein
MTSTLKRMLTEYEAAAQEVLQNIKRVKREGNDDDAALFSATSLIHQKSKSILRQLEKEANAADAAEDNPKPKRR